MAVKNWPRVVISIGSLIWPYKEVSRELCIKRRVLNLDSKPEEQANG
jgi:hypothetical protein